MNKILNTKEMFIPKRLFHLTVNYMTMSLTNSQILGSSVVERSG